MATLTKRQRDALNKANAEMRMRTENIRQENRHLREENDKLEAKIVDLKNALYECEQGKEE